MKRFQLKRISKSLEVTLGVFIDPNTGLPICLSLENPWLENKREVSCIPKGLYIVSTYSSEKYPGVYEVKEVDGRYSDYSIITMRELEGFIKKLLDIVDYDLKTFNKIWDSMPVEARDYYVEIYGGPGNTIIKGHRL